MSKEGTITITKREYFELRRDSDKLSMLEAGGVDNWEGYSDSLYPDDPQEYDMNEIEENLKKEIFDERQS